MLDKICRPMVILVISGFRYAEAYAVGKIVWCNGIDMCSRFDNTTVRLQNDVAKSCSKVCVSGAWVLGISLQHKEIQLGLP